MNACHITISMKNNGLILKVEVAVLIQISSVTMSKEHFHKISPSEVMNIELKFWKIDQSCRNLILVGFLRNENQAKHINVLSNVNCLFFHYFKFTYKFY